MSEKTKEQLKKEIKDLKTENKRLETLADLRHEEYIIQKKIIEEQNKALETILNNLDIYQFSNKYSINTINSIEYGVKFKLKHRIIYLDSNKFSNLIKTYHDIGATKNIPYFVRSEVYSKI